MFIQHLIEVLTAAGIVNDNDPWILTQPVEISIDDALVIIKDCDANEVVRGRFHMFLR